MQKGNLKSYLNLHLIVFIWGFTAILGALLTINADVIVWYRMVLASLFLGLSIVFNRKSFFVSFEVFLKLLFVGLLIALHWIFFFRAIHLSNVSVTLSVFSLGAFFASLIEPLFFGRKVILYEVLFGLITIVGFGFILNTELKFIEGILYALIAIILGVLFTILNGKLIQENDSTLITFYEFISGTFFISIYFLTQNTFNIDFFELTQKNWILLLILSSICTAYAFTASVKVMEKLSPYTVMLTTNLEPVYGIILAYFIIGGKEKMGISFYLGASVIFVLVLLNSIYKNRSENQD